MKEQPSEELEKRIDELQQRIDELEQAVEDLTSDECSSEHETEGDRAIKTAVADVLKGEQFVAGLVGLCKLPEKWTSLKEKEFDAEKELTHKLYLLGIVFSVVLLLVVSTLAWNDKISKEITAGLLGSLIGYWYGRERPK
ncbi:MAG: hypothetical protein ABL967_02555 [Bryobacteraceae bacterium]